MSDYWKELALKFYEKAKILKQELLIDFKYNAYNKTISTAYFMIEALANALFALKKQKTRGFSGRANLVRELFGIEIYKQFLKLHEFREKADHREVIFNECKAKEIFNASLKMFKVFEEALRQLIE